MVVCFPQASLSLPAATAADSETPCVCARQSYPRQPWRRARELPQGLGHWFCPQNLRLTSGTAFREIARWPAGAWTWTQTWTVPPDQRVVKVLSAPKPQNKLCGVSILFRSIKNAEIEDICPRQYQPLSPDCCIVPQFWRSQKNSNSTQFIELYFGVSEQIKPLQPTGQAAEFKFETKFEALSPCLPVPVI